MSRKQALFVSEYLVDFNSTQAAIRAGYSPKTARAIGARQLTKVDIQTAIAVAQRAREQRTLITQDRTLAEIAVVAFSDITHYAIDRMGHVALADGAPPTALRAVSSLKRRVTISEHGETIETEIRLWNKTQALKQAGDHLGLFRDPTAALNAKFFEGFLGVLAQHIGEGNPARQAIFGYLEEYLGETDTVSLTRGSNGTYAAPLGPGLDAGGGTGT